jgi:peroxiredoxin
MKILLLVILAGLLLSCNPEPSYKINGTINMDSGMMYLKQFRNKMFFIVDSSFIQQGTFTFKGRVDRPYLYGLSIYPDASPSPHFIFVENADISVDVDTTDGGTAKISGSVEHDLFEYYRKNRKGFDIADFIKQNPTSSAAAYILYREFSPVLDAGQLADNAALFDSTLHDLYFLTELETIIETKRSVEPGKLAPNFSGLTPEGSQVQLSDFRGRYLLLDFWASWCPPCRRENPNLVKTYRLFKDKGFEIFAVSLDRDRDDWVKAIQDDELSWIHVSDLKFWDCEPAKLYGIRGIPSNVLIGPDGIILANNLEGEGLINQLNEIYK